MLVAGCGRKDETASPEFVARTIAKYEGMLVRRPGAGVEDQKVYFVKDGRKHWVPSAIWVKDHGFRWPQDVKVLTGEQLDAIPLGPTAQ